MFLSRLVLNPRNAQVRRELARPYELHRTIMKAFPEGRVHVCRADGDAAGVLFRAEELAHDQLVRLLVQSRIAPDWTRLGNHADHRGQPYLAPAPTLPDGKPNPAVKEFDLRLAAGQVLAFRLRANPTERHAFSDKKRRIGVYGEVAQIAWLARKGERGGFRLAGVRTGANDRVRGEIHRDEEHHALNLLSVQFDGLLQVTDPDRLRQTVAQGIGSGKGLGFGLLSLAPAR